MTLFDIDAQVLHLGCPPMTAVAHKPSILVGQDVKHFVEPARSDIAAVAYHWRRHDLAHATSALVVLAGLGKALVLVALLSAF